MTGLQARTWVCSGSGLLLRGRLTEANVIRPTLKAKLGDRHWCQDKTGWFTQDGRFKSSCLRKRKRNFGILFQFLKIKQSRPWNHFSIYHSNGLEALEWVEVEFFSRSHKLHRFNSMWTFAPLMDRSLGPALLSRQPNIQTRQFSFLKFNPVFLLRHFLLMRGPKPRRWLTGRRSQRSLGKVGQTASKISCRKPFVAPNQSERGLMRLFVASRGLSGGAVAHGRRRSRDDEQWWPDPAVQPLIGDAEEARDSFHLY